MAQVLNRIKLEAAQKRVRPKEFFSDFDQLRKGEVSEAQFRRALSMMNFSLSSADMDGVCKLFKFTNGLVNYRSFIAEMESAFLDESEASPVKAALKQIGTSKLTESELANVNSALQQFKQIMKVQRIMVKPVFQDFDRANTGHVTVSQFTRVLTTTGLLPTNSEVIRLITNLYTDSHLGVNYQAFCKAVDDIDTIGGIVSGPTETTFEPMPKPQTVQDLTATRFFDAQVPRNAYALEVEDRLKAEVAMKGVRASEFFRDYDRLRKGTVKEGQFTSALGMLNLRLSEADIQSMIEKYRDERGDVKYTEFCRYIESAPDALDKLPEVRPPSYISTVEARRKFLEFSEAEKSLLIETLASFQITIRNRRVHLRPMFQDFDITKSGHVSRTQFTRVLNQLNLAPSEELLRVILKRYLDKGNMEEVNYMDFCKDVDKPEEIFTPDQQSGPEIDKVLDMRRTLFKNLQYTTRPVVEGKINSHNPEDLNDLISRLRLQVKQNRIRIFEFIRDFDRLRTGIITKTQLRSAFSMAKLPLSDSEFHMICEQYQVDGARIGYQPLLDQIDQVFTLKGLEKTNADITDINTQTRYGASPLTDQERAIAQGAIERFRDFTVNNVLDIKSHFQDWDRHNSLKISPKQFRQVLSQFRFYLSDDEFNALKRKYDSNGFIRYVDFVNDSLPVIYNQREDAVDIPASKTRGFNIHTPYCMNNPPDEDMKTILQRIQLGVKVKRIRAQEFMSEHDPLRKGYIPIAKFRGAIDNMKLDLSGRDLDMLQEYFKVTDDLVNYAAFVEICEEVFTAKGLEKDPLNQPRDVTNYLDPKDVLTQAEEQELENCLIRLGHQIFTRRIYMKPFFQDKDKVNAGWVNTTRFRSIMNFAGLMINDREYEVLCKRFSHKRSEVRYADFLAVVAHYSGDDKPF